MTALTLLKIFGAALLITYAWGGLSAAPYLPTRKKQRQALLDELSLRGDEVVLDLGSGDGSLLFELEQQYPGLQLTGFEISLLPLLIAWVRKAWKRSNVHLYWKNLFRQNLSQADLIFIYLLDQSYPRLQKKFAQELKPNALVIVEAWPMQGVEPEKVLRTPNLLPVYFYRGSAFQKPEKK